MDNNFQRTASETPHVLLDCVDVTEADSGHGLSCVAYLWLLNEATWQKNRATFQPGEAFQKSLMGRSDER